MNEIKDEWWTIRKLQGGCSIARFGDGEFKLCLGHHQFGNNRSGQTYNGEVRKCLLSVLQRDVPGLVVGVPSFLYTNRESGWIYERAKGLLPPGKVYGSSLITRPDRAPHINTLEYLEECSKIWDKRHVVLVQGKGREFERSRALDNTSRLDIIYGPLNNAFGRRLRLEKKLFRFPKDVLFMFSLGPAATVFASDMHKRGWQALDIGHFAMFYKRRLQNG